MNSRLPNTAAKLNAVQVQGSTSFERRATELSRDVIPSNLKSIIAIEPTTIASAMTCSVSIIGKSHSVPGNSPRTAADNATVGSVFIVGPDKKVKAMIVYPMSTGRNFDEVLRLLDSVQLNAKHTVAKKKYPQGFKTHKPYLRTVGQPK